MPSRTLAADEAALWARVMADVRPLRAVAPVRPLTPPRAAAPPAVAALSKSSIPAVTPRPVPVLAPAPRPRETLGGATLDGGWDRRIGRGAVMPDDVIDLHGHTLSSAHAMLDRRLGEAVARGDRILLLVTGRPPRPESERPHARGAIRAAVADWLAASRHAGAIAAVRNAHPRHGGAGALYVVLRRRR